MSYNCGCTITNEPTIPENYIKIFRGDDTDFNNSKFLKILLVTDIDLTGFKGIFNLLGFSYTGNVNATDKSLEIEIPASATSNFPIGPAQGVFRLEDTSNKLKTVSNTIPFYVTNQIFTDQPEEIILDVPPNYPIFIFIKVYENGSGGDVNPPAPGGTSDYNELSNIPTFNGTPWKGNMTFQGADIAPLSGLTALEDVVDEKASAVDVQNGLNGLQTQITTNKNDIGGLGDQVAEIEAKIPESASTSNPIATMQDVTNAVASKANAATTLAGYGITDAYTKTEVDDKIAQAGGGDVDLNGYYNQDNLIAGNNVTITEVLPEGGIDEHTLACWHLDGNYTNAVQNSNWQDFGNNTKSGQLNTDFYKFGSASWEGYASTITTAGYHDARYSFTLDLWAQKYNTNGTGWTSFGFIDNNDTGGFGFKLNFGVNNNLIRLAGDKLVSTVEVDLTDFGINSGDTYFHHYALTYDKEIEKVALFVDGKQVATANVTPNSVFTEALRVAYRYGNFRIDEVRLSDVVRYTKDFTPATKAYSVAEPTGKRQINAIIPAQVAIVSDEKYGIQADYALKHGIIDCPNGLIDFSINTKEIETNPGIVLQLAGADTQTTLASKEKYTIKETGKITLFLAKTGSTQIGFLEAADVYYQEAEPTNGTNAYLAWYSPLVGKWQFKSDDTGNVWREAVATPIANINAGATGITSINYIGYSVNDGRNCASLSDIESLQEQDTTIMQRLEAVEGNIVLPEIQQTELPSASTMARRFVQTVNAAGDKKLAYSDGDEWYEILKTRLS